MIEMLKKKYDADPVSPFPSPSKATASPGVGVFGKAAGTPSSASVGVTASTAGAGAGFGAAANPSSCGRDGRGQVGSPYKLMDISLCHSGMVLIVFGLS